MRRFGWIATGVALVLGATTAVVLAGRNADESPAPDPARRPAVRPSGKRIDWIAASSGGTPELTQVSLEQDIGLAADVLGGHGHVLFGAGAGYPVVQVLADSRPSDPVRDPLRDLFAPRGGRDATYRAPMIDVDGPATAASVWEVLRRALGEGNAPLLVFLGGHGLPGETPIDNTLGLWASSSVSAGELASLLGESARPTHLVVTTCYSGGFAEIAFREGAAELGAAPHPHCGLFAAPWDLEASGCDPDPDRARQEGYAIHFFNALAGRDRDKKALDRASLDLDDDGRISLLEAHTRVRIASAGPDVPTTTSERWLRQALAGDPPPAGDAPDVSLPEEAAVVAALGESLGLAGHEADARAKYQHLEDTITVLDERLRQAQAAEDLAFAQAAADILARWPVLDDPWHPEFRATLDANETALARHFAESESYVAYLAAREAVDRLDRELADRRTAAAPLERLVRALETVALARALARRGGPAWDRYQALLACERWIPPVRGHSR